MPWVSCADEWYWLFIKKSGSKIRLCKQTLITPSWLSGLWRPFLYSSSVYSCHLLISSAFVRSISFLSFIAPIFVWNVLLLSLIFLKRLKKNLEFVRMNKRDPWWWKIGYWSCPSPDQGRSPRWYWNSLGTPSWWTSSLSYREPRHYLIVVNLSHLSQDNPSNFEDSLKPSLACSFL